MSQEKTDLKFIWGNAGIENIEKKIFSIGTEIYFNSYITDDSINALIKEFNNVISSQKKFEMRLYTGDEEIPINITLFITSYGGHLDATFRFVDYINNLKKTGRLNELTTVMTGHCASASTIIAQLGDYRYMTHYCIVLIHELSSSNFGNYTKMDSYMKMLRKLHRDIVNIFVSKSNLTEEEIRTLFLKETWLSSNQYLKKGLIDGIYGEDQPVQNIESEKIQNVDETINSKRKNSNNNNNNTISKRQRV